MKLRGIAALAVAGLLVGGCYGPFELTRKVYKWNGEVSDNKWTVEGVFLICSILPIYYFAGAADAIVLNSVVFWTGKSMLALAPTGSTQRIARGNEETVLTRVSGDELKIEQFRNGTPTASMRLRHEGDKVVALNADGATLLSSQTMADGSIVVADASGRTVASHSADDVKQLAKSVQE